jgi:outer membrane protein OmpA-like peptidoglycan-associated protein
LSSKGRLFQMVRIDVPRRTTVEAELERSCRAELPGVYFAFGSSELQPASEPAVASVAALLGRHTDWSLAVEGHTDSVGDDAANQRLSLARAEAVRSALAERGVAFARIRAEGYGATRPREPNSTLEGRARNRRVELVRNCGTS